MTFYISTYFCRVCVFILLVGQSLRSYRYGAVDSLPRGKSARLGSEISVRSESEARMRTGQKQRQNPGAISRYFNAQKADPSLDPPAARRTEPKGPLRKTDSDAGPMRHLVSARIPPGLTAPSKNNADVNPFRVVGDRGAGGADRPVVSILTETPTVSPQICQRDEPS